MFKFEKLEVWQKAVQFADMVYDITKTFPVDERFGLTNQLRRSAVSISSNLAEGSSRSSETDFARFIEITYGSLLESVSEMEIARRQKFLNPEIFERTYHHAEDLGRMLSGLRRTVQAGS